MTIPKTEITIYTIRKKFGFKAITKGRSINLDQKY